MKTVRIEQIEINGIKNILHGSIDLPEYKNIKAGNFEFNSVLGIYGQNGSGKTTVLEVTKILKNILIGEPLPKDIDRIINNETDKANIVYTFFIQINNNKKLVTYEFEIAKINSDKEISYDIIFEKLTSKTYNEEAHKYNRPIVLFKGNQNSITSKNLAESFSQTQLTELRVAKDIEKGTSLLFNKRNLNIILDRMEELNSQEFINVVLTLKLFALYNLIIIENSYIGSAAISNVSPIITLNIHLQDYDTLCYGRMPLHIFKSNLIEKDIFNNIQTIINQIDIVLNAIIPDLHIKIVNTKEEMTENGEIGIRFEVASFRNDKYIPLWYESEGIKRIISITSALIAVYNNPSICLMIDEFDSGIFEYLLGEIIQVLDETAQGQFIFTSHNLHVLEKLSYKSIILTTTNPYNRFIYFNNVKPNNNVRDFYYTSILLGGQKEELYKETRGYSIRKAFRKAGHLYE